MRRVLARTRNYGAPEFDGQPVPGSWPAILTEDDVTRVRTLLADPARRTSTTNRVRYLLSGIARCGVCGGPVKTGQTRSVNGRTRKIYKCSRADHVYRAVEVADYVVTSTVLMRLEALTPERRQALLAPETDSPLAAKAAQLRAKMAEALEMWKADEMTRAEHKATLASLRARLAVIERKMGSASKAPVLAEVMSAADVREAWESLEFDRQRSVMDALVEVTINRGAKLRQNTPLNLQTAAMTIKWRIGPPTEDEWTRLVSAK